MTNSDRQGTKSQWRTMLRAVGGVAGEQDGDARRELNNVIGAMVAEFLASEVPPDLRVVVYDALGDEIDLSAVVENHSAPAERFAVTRTPEVGFDLTVHPWGGPVERHRYGYLQPQASAPAIADKAIGAVLVPALAFDVAGNRLGRGKGYYDRFLARLQSHHDISGRPTALVGMAGEAVADRLPHDGHDIAMTHLALASGVWTVPIPRLGLAEITRLAL